MASSIRFRSGDGSSRVGAESVTWYFSTDGLNAVVMSSPSIRIFCSWISEPSGTVTSRSETTAVVQARQAPRPSSAGVKNRPYFCRSNSALPALT